MHYTHREEAAHSLCSKLLHQMSSVGSNPTLSALNQQSVLSKIAHRWHPWRVSDLARGQVRVPPSVRDAALARFSKLSPAAKNIVELASLVPGTAEDWLIQEILHLDSTALDECVERGILRSMGNTLAFRHELARQSVEDSLPVGKSRDLHTKILAALLLSSSGVA
jgi:hypothetical protein